MGDHRPAHARRGVDRETTARLAELGRQLPPPSEEAARTMAADRVARLKRRLAVGVVVVVLMTVAALAGVQWFRPLPQPALEGLATRIRVPGAPLELPWPSTGEGGLSVPGLGNLGHDRDSGPVPVGVLSGVLVAYVILKDHPLPTGGVSGPAIAVTTRALAAYRAGTVVGEPEVPVTSRESLTELDALEGLLVDSGNDMATLLADWDAKSTSAFVTEMERNAASLGLRHTRITAPSGAGAVISTPGDLLVLAEAAMRIPVFRQIVSLGEVELPKAGLRYNQNFLLGKNGVVGIEAGADTPTDGCYLFAAQKSVTGHTVTLYGAVLGQSGPIGPQTAAVDAGDTLLRAALSDITAVRVLRPGRVVGHLSVPWGASTPVVVNRAVTVPALRGLDLSVTGRLAKLTLPVEAGSRVGWVQIREGPRVIVGALHSTAPLEGPSWVWRLVR